MYPTTKWLKVQDIYDNLDFRWCEFAVKKLCVKGVIIISFNFN